MTMEKYGVDYAAVKKLMDQGASEEEALEKVASGQISQEGAQTGRTSGRQQNQSNQPKSKEDHNG